MADEAKPKKLTLGEALKDLGWFPIVFAVAVGGPSILSIVESVLVDHQLVPALQWIVDGYDRIMAVLGAAVEPLVQPAIDWVNARFGWELVLDPVWRPVFALGMIFVTAGIRNGIRSGDAGTALIAGIQLALAFLATAIGVGLFAASPSWIVQGSIAAAPALTLTLVLLALTFTREDLSDLRENRSGSTLLLVSSAISLFVIGAGLSLAPGFAHGGGIAALGGAVVFLGIGFVLSGLKHDDTYHSRFGLTILGGFVAAGLILAADWGLKAMGAG